MLAVNSSPDVDRVNFCMAQAQQGGREDQGLQGWDFRELYP